MTTLIVPASTIRARIAASGIPDIDAETPYHQAACGTHKGWYRHKRAGQQPCQPCTDAKRAQRREYERARRAATTTEDITNG